MPHTVEKRYAVVSCHVERPLDDPTWQLFSRLQRRRPGGFPIAALLRPPDEAHGEDAETWLARAREAAARGPLGHHTHWGGPGTARPPAGSPEPAALVRREALWLRERGLRPTLFCGGGWYLDAAVAEALAELGYADCTATAFRPAYLAEASPRASLAAPARLRLGELSLVELPTTHSLGMAARAALTPRRSAAPVLHVYFHDTDLLDRRRRAALVGALRLLGRRRTATDLDRLREELGPLAPEIPFARVARGEGSAPPAAVHST